MKCCDLTPGQLRSVVEFQQANKTPNGRGGSTVTWAAVPGAPTRAKVKHVSGSERYRAGRLEAATQARIYVRYSPLINASQRVLLDGEALQIRAVLDIENRKRWLEIYAESGVVT